MSYVFLQYESGSDIFYMPSSESACKICSETFKIDVKPNSRTFPEIDILILEHRYGKDNFKFEKIMRKNQTTIPGWISVYQEPSRERDKWAACCIDEDGNEESQKVYAVSKMKALYELIKLLMLKNRTLQKQLKEKD